MTAASGISSRTAEPLPRRSESRRAAFTLFACLWAVAALFDLASYGQWGTSAPVAGAALLVLLLPGRVWPMAALAATQVGSAAMAAPYLSNHWLFAAMANGVLLLALGGLVVRQRHVAIDPADVYAAIAPGLRSATIVLYFFVVFHKLNADFFDPAVSCGTFFYATQLDRLPFLPRSAGLDIAAIYLALGFEVLIPLLLVVSRTRALGILAGTLFHGFLALNPNDPFYNFSSMMIAIYSVFLPDGLAAGLLARIGRKPFRWMAAGTAAAFTGLALAGRFGTVWGSGPDPFLVLWGLYFAAAVAGVVWLLSRPGWAGAEAAAFFVGPRRRFGLFPLLVLVNGLTPYAGLKTETAWAMFSNLRTEGGATNHFLVPATTQLFDFQRDLVRPTGSSDRYLQALADRKQAVPYFEIRRRADVAASYLRDGTEHRYGGATGNAGGPDELPWLLQKSLWFRPVEPDGPQTCKH